MADITPLPAAIGGGLIGPVRRAADVADRPDGIFGGLLDLGNDDKGWRIAFIAGLILAPLIAGWIGHAMP